MLGNSGESCNKVVLDSESGTASRQIIQRERAIHQRNLAEQAERWRAHSMEILIEGRAAVSTQRQEVLAERDKVIQLQGHLAETQAPKLLKSTRYNRLCLQQGSSNQLLSPLLLCKDMFLLNYYLLHRYHRLWHHYLLFNPLLDSNHHHHLATSK